MRYFGTLFDKNYMAKGLALHLSMEMHIPRFQLFVLCLDDVTYEYLTGLGKPTLRPIRLAEVEAVFPELMTAKGNRSTVEYYFTLSPVWPLYLLRKFPDIDLITTLDADIFFLGSPEPIYESFKSYSILITPHRFPANVQWKEMYGKFNVSFQVFRNDRDGLACLEHWMRQCLEWCYDYPDQGRFADQLYLDSWQQKFSTVQILTHPGAGLAPWNASDIVITESDGTLQVGSEPLIFFHFHKLKSLGGRLFLHGFDEYEGRMSRSMRKLVYRRYLLVLERMTASFASKPDVSLRKSQQFVRNRLLAKNRVLYQFHTWLFELDLRQSIVTLSLVKRFFSRAWQLKST